MNPVVARVRMYREAHRPLTRIRKRGAIGVGLLGSIFWGILILEPGMMNAVEILPPVSAGAVEVIAQVVSGISKSAHTVALESSHQGGAA